MEQGEKERRSVVGCQQTLLLSSSPCSIKRRSDNRGLTIVEIMIVLSIMALVVGAVIAGTSRTPAASLRRSTTMIASAVKVAYTRATATSKDLRLVLDLDNQKVWIEESDIPMLAQARDKTGTGGADPVTQAEKDALAEGNKILKGPPIPKPHFHAIEALGFADNGPRKGGKPLPSGITIRSVQTAHDDTPRTSGRAYLYFWPGGRTERASVQLRIEKSEISDQTMTVLVSPLTGRATVKGGAVDLVVPTDDKEASEREDTGF
jgi:general secretion pathway protein H